MVQVFVKIPLGCLCSVQRSLAHGKEVREARAVLAFDHRLASIPPEVICPEQECNFQSRQWEFPWWPFVRRTCQHTITPSSTLTSNSSTVDATLAIHLAIAERVIVILSIAKKSLCL